MLHGGIPIFLGDARAGVGGLHVAASVEAGTTRRVTEKVNHVLAQFLFANRRSGR